MSRSDPFHLEAPAVGLSRRLWVLLLRRGSVGVFLAILLGFALAALNNAGLELSISLPLTLGCGLVVGLFNGLAVVVLRLPPLLATLASMNVLAGLELVLTENTVVPTDSPLLDLLSSGSWLGVPALAWVLLAMAGLLTLLIQHTAYGLRLQAVGEYSQAAQAAGIPLAGYVLSSYLLAGLCAAVAALCSAALGGLLQWQHHRLWRHAAVGGGNRLSRCGVLPSACGEYSRHLVGDPADRLPDQWLSTAEYLQFLGISPVSGSMACKAC